MYPQAKESIEDDKDDKDDDGDDVAADIEKEIQAEVTDIRKPSKPRLFTPLTLNVPCGQYCVRQSRGNADFSAVVFFKTLPPVEPVSFVKTICEDAQKDSSHKRTRFAKRLSPMTLVGRASTEGLEKVAVEVLKPHFHQDPFQKRKVCPDAQLYAKMSAMVARACFYDMTDTTAHSLPFVQPFATIP